VLLIALPTKVAPLAIGKRAPMHTALVQDFAGLLRCNVMLGDGHTNSCVVVVSPFPFLTSHRAVCLCAHFAHFHILIGASAHRAAHVFHIFTSTASNINTFMQRLSTPHTPNCRCAVCSDPRHKLPTRVFICHVCAQYYITTNPRKVICYHCLRQ